MAHLAVGIGLWSICAALDAALAPALDEPLFLRLLRRWSEHPLRMMAAVTLLAWTVSSLRARPETQEMPHVEPP
jgi:cyanate permease